MEPETAPMVVNCPACFGEGTQGEGDAAPPCTQCAGTGKIDAATFTYPKFGLDDGWHWHTIRSLAELDESGSLSWPGCYPVLYYDAKVTVWEDGTASADMTGGGPLCFDCAKEAWADAVSSGQTFVADVIEESESGEWCENCHTVLFCPACRECFDVASGEEEFAEWHRCDDYGWLCPKCFAKRHPTCGPFGHIREGHATINGRFDS